MPCTIVNANRYVCKLRALKRAYADVGLYGLLWRPTCRALLIEPLRWGCTRRNALRLHVPTTQNADFLMKTHSAGWAYI